MGTLGFFRTSGRVKKGGKYTPRGQGQSSAPGGKKTKTARGFCVKKKKRKLS